MVSSVLFSATLLAALHLAPADKIIPSTFRAEFKAGDVPFPTGAPGATGATGGGTAGGGTMTNTSTATCYSIGFGSSNATTSAAIAKSVVDVSAYVCNTGPKDKAVEEDIASAIAVAFASAVADASVVCEGEGNVDVYGRAYVKAEASTTAFLGAYADALAESSNCDNTCDAAAIAFGYIEQEVFLSAVAESEAVVDSYQAAAEIGGIQGFRQFRAKATEFNSDTKVAIATSFAKAIAGAKDYYEEKGCFAWVNAGGCIWTPDAEDPDACFECTALSVGKAKIKEIPALAEAEAFASAYTCGNDTEAFAEAEASARALAEATAEALSFAYAECTADDGGFACSGGISAAQAIARTTAEAFAEAWADGYTCEETCIVESESAVEAISEIFAAAFTTAFAQVCAANGESWSAASLAESIQTETVEAVASAIAEAVVGGDECFAATGTFVSTG